MRRTPNGGRARIFAIAAAALFLVQSSVAIAASDPASTSDPVGSLVAHASEPQVPSPLEERLRELGLHPDVQHTLPSLLARLGALPEGAAEIPVASHVLGVTAPARLLPMLYESRAVGSEHPLRTAILAYNAALDLTDHDDLLRSPELHAADELPLDVQVAVAVLLYAITDATMLQKQAVQGLSAEDYTSLLRLPGALASGELDPLDESEEAAAAIQESYRLLSLVDRRPIDEGAMVLTHALAHVMPALEAWSERVQALESSASPHLRELDAFLRRHQAERIQRMDPVERLDILVEALHVAAATQGIQVPLEVQPLPPPDGARPLRAAVASLIDTMGVADELDPELVEEELTRADLLPLGLQRAVARIVVNHDALARATLEAAAASAGAGDETAPASPESGATPLDPRLGAELRAAEIRVVRAVQASAPTLEAWGLFWDRNGQAPLPATPLHAPAKLYDAKQMSQEIASPEAGLEEIVRLAAGLQGPFDVSSDPPALPGRGALAQSVVAMYARYGLPVDDETRRRIGEGGSALPETVERNVARILQSQLAALDDLEALYTGLGPAERQALSSGPGIVRTLALDAELSARDVQTLRDYYALTDRVQSVYLGAASRLAAAVDASAGELEAYALASQASAPATGAQPVDEPSAEAEPSSSPATAEPSSSASVARDAAEEEPASATTPAPVASEPERQPWWIRLWTMIKGIRLLGTAAAQSAPGEPHPLPYPPCPAASPLADCANDVWFMDPYLQTIVVSGFGSTEFDSRRMGKVWQRPGGSGDGRETTVDARGQMLTVSLGGDDVYRNNAGGATALTVRGETLPGLPFDALGMSPPPRLELNPSAVAVALDLDGSDWYLPSSDSRRFPATQGSGLGGIGILYDRRGDDRFIGRGLAQGFGGSATSSNDSAINALYGVGILVSGDGNDRYEADAYSQGAALGAGLGILADRAGRDRYTLRSGTATSPAIGQGGATGTMFAMTINGRPFVAAGGAVGILVEAEGDDRYQGGAQGNGTMGGLGVLLDIHGADTYSRPPMAESNHPPGWWNGKCWASPRASANPTPAASRATGNTTAWADAQFRMVNTSTPPPVLLSQAQQRPQQAVNDSGMIAQDLFNATLQDSSDVSVMAGGGHGIVVDIAGTGCDVVSSMPEADVEALLQDLQEALSGGGVQVDPSKPTHFLVRVPPVISLGGMEDSVYPCPDLHEKRVLWDISSGTVADQFVNAGIRHLSCDFAVTIELGGNNTYANRAGSDIGIVGALVRPWVPVNGRIPGLAVDVQGNDRYAHEGTCAQGCNGILIDLQGDDVYVAQRDSQGVATNMGLFADGVQGGVGVFTSTWLNAGVLFDALGDDIYRIRSKAGDSIGQGSAGHLPFSDPTGVGILIDASGRDRYDSPAQGTVQCGEFDLVVQDLATQHCVALFLDLIGEDTYRPVGKQGMVVSGGGVAAFIDAEGRDHYVGSPQHATAPDWDKQRNGRLDYRSGVSYAQVYWDVEGGNNAQELLAALSSTDTRSLHLGPLGVSIGGTDEVVEEDYVLMVNPSTESNVYRNNAGGSLLRLRMERSHPGPASTWFNATYRPEENYPIAAIHVDMNGNERYEPKDPLENVRLRHHGTRESLVQGAGFLATGILVDTHGDDAFVASALSQGFGLYGWGILWDERGNDTYRHDPALVRNPSVHQGMVVWEQYSWAPSDLASISSNTWSTNANMTLRTGGHRFAGLTTGSWELHARRGDCGGILTSTQGRTVHGATASAQGVAFAVFDLERDLWRAYRWSPQCPSGGVPTGVPVQVSDHPSNMINPKFFDGNRIVWQDDRDGTWSLYHKRLTASTGGTDELLGVRNEMGVVLLGEWVPGTSNQTNPDSHGSVVVYQDDRPVPGSAGCPSGRSGIYLYDHASGIEFRVDNLPCAQNANPRVSDQFVVWQSRPAGEEESPWKVVVFNRATGVTRVLGTEGSAYAPDVAGQRIVYTRRETDGTPSVMMYDWGTEIHRLLQEEALQVSLDRTTASRGGTWISASGSLINSVSNEAWEVYWRDDVTLPATLSGLRQSRVAEVDYSRWMQGASYAAGKGLLIDLTGLDTYRGLRFSQGAAASLLAPKTDFRPTDGKPTFVSVSGVQGTTLLLPGAGEGEMFSHGVLADFDGNDAYSAQSESQGVHFAREVTLTGMTQIGDGSTFPGNNSSPPGAQSPFIFVEAAEGVGALVDVRGSDSYAAMANSQGYGALMSHAGLTMTPGTGQVGLPYGAPRIFADESYGFLLDFGGIDHYVYAPYPPDGAWRPPIYRVIKLGEEWCNTGSEEITRGLPLVLNGAWSDVLRQPFQETCNTAEDAATGAASAVEHVREVRDTTRASQQRNNEIWQQKTRAAPGDIENSTIPTHCISNVEIGKDAVVGRPCPPGVNIGGIGADLPLMDVLDSVLAKGASQVLHVELEVSRQESPWAALQVATSLEGIAYLGANVTFDQAALKQGVRIERVEFFIGPAGSQKFVGYHASDRPAAESRLYIRPWNTIDYPDGNYSVRVRVHYGTDRGTIGFVEGEASAIKVDNAPVIVAGASIVRVLDMDGRDASLAFSPSPFGNHSRVPTLPLIEFQLPPDPFLGPFVDGWVSVFVTDAMGARVRTLLSDQPVGSTGVQQTWDGTHEDGSIAPAGVYTIWAEATDRAPGNRVGASRNTSAFADIAVHSRVPFGGCVKSRLDLPCVPANSVVTLANSGNPDKTTVTLHPALMAWTPTLGYHEMPPAHVHVFLGVTDNDGNVIWNKCRSTCPELHQGSFEVELRHGEYRHVLVLGEDAMGNIECLPACGSVDVASMVGDRAAALIAARDKKANLSYVTLQADLVRPGIKLSNTDGFRVEGQVHPLSSLPRVNGSTNLEIRFQLTKPASAIVDLRHRDDPNFVMQDIVMPYDGVNVTWAKWGSSVKEHWEVDHWPEGIVMVALNARDAVGNELRSVDVPRASLILDRTAPTVLGVDVIYPNERHHAETGDRVTLRIAAADPAVGGLDLHPKDLKYAVDAVNVTGEDVVVRWHQQQEVAVATVPVTHDLGDLRAAVIQVTVRVADTAGNVAQIPVSITLGAPQFDLMLVSEEPTTAGFQATWTAAAGTEAHLQYRLAGAADEPVSVPAVSSSEERIGQSLRATHFFRVSQLLPGAAYDYRIVVRNESGAIEAGGWRKVTTLRGVEIAVLNPASLLENDQIVSGVYRVRGTAMVETDAAAEVRVTLRLKGLGLPPAGRPVFDGFTKLHQFEMDLVTEALEDGRYELEATAEYRGERSTQIVRNLVIDNSPPEIRVVDPAPDSFLREPLRRVLVRVADALTAVEPTTTRLYLNGAYVPRAAVSYHPDGDGSGGVLEIIALARTDPGVVKLEVFVNDVGGNVGHGIARILYDPEEPEVARAFVSYPSGQRAARPGQLVVLHLEGAKAPSGVVSVSADTSGVGGDVKAAFNREREDKYVLPIRLPQGQGEGSWPVGIVLRDGAGNVRSFTVPVLVDATPPDPAAIRLTWHPRAATLMAEALEDIQVSIEARAVERPSIRAASDPAFLPQQVISILGMTPGVEYDLVILVRDQARHEVEIRRTVRFLPDAQAPPAVDKPRAMATASGVRLEWLPSDSQGAVEYLINRAEGSFFEHVGTVSGRSYVDLSAHPGASYRYFIQARDPLGRLGGPSAPIDVVVPLALPAEDVEASVHPLTGVAHETVFTFTVTLRDLNAAEPSVWLVLEDGPRRMSQLASDDCRNICTFRLATRLPALDLSNPEPVYYVEVFGDQTYLRLPDGAGWPAPTVVDSRDGGAAVQGNPVLQEFADNLLETPAPALPVLLLAFLLAWSLGGRRKPVVENKTSSWWRRFR